VCHMAAVFSRQSYQCSFDERADAGDLPQDRLAPRHEPIFDGFSGFHDWTVFLRANKSNKKRACDKIFLPQAIRNPLQPLFRRLFSLPD